MHRPFDNHWVTLADFLLVLLSGVAWIIIPKFGIWFTLIALLSLGSRLLTARQSFQHTSFDWLIVLFVMTSWIGYWAAYDKTTAWVKVWLIVTAALIYFTLRTQPKQNLGYVSFISFCFGIGLSIHFFLTNDFIGSREGVATWWMSNRPQVDWTPIHHGYTSGLLVLTSIFASYWLWNIRKKSINYFSLVKKIFLFFGIGIVILAFLLTMSRGIWVIGLGILGIWILWKVSISAKFAKTMRSRFPVLVMVSLVVLIVFALLVPARNAGGSTHSNYGSNSRAELLRRSAYFVADYPFTGAGLNSFPGLYSQYMIVIPFFYFTNSYNLFMDIAIEQGLLGGLIFICLCLGGVWAASQAIIRAQSSQTRNYSWMNLFALIFTILHGLFYDYLYNGIGTMLLFYPIGISMMEAMRYNHPADKTTPLLEKLPILNKINNRRLIILVIGVIILFPSNINHLMSVWYANLGAVRMSQVELRDFPTNRWAEIDMAPNLESANESLRSAVKYDPNNQTANYRLGMISMLSRNFETACAYLERAHEKASSHRGIIKSLGYCYVWMGNLEKAQLLLAQIPEAKKELDVYVWWWETQGRSDLSEKASMMAAQLKGTR